jgi:hypothetical protein
MRRFVAAAALLIASPATAEVVSSGEHGFEIRQSAIVPLPPRDAMNAFANVGAWWDGSHAYSGNASNLSMSLQPGGCFCERLPGGGGIEHLRVTYVDPGKRVVLTGSLGPLLFQATAGVMDIQFQPVGSGSRVSLTYKVAGFANGGADKLAPLVDRVLGGQVARYVISTSPPAAAR